ncbi:MAG TPA: SAM-dependent methyltransferase, partial [Acidimicrobiia bacterium]|nr:SAM-dependent methyltransferase [Acidimicrobiia bacterium]
DWWAPFSQSVGPVGRILGGLDDEGRRRLEEISREVFPSDSETLDLSVWAARGVVGDHTM